MKEGRREGVLERRGKEVEEKGRLRRVKVEEVREGREKRGGKDSE